MKSEKDQRTEKGVFLLFLAVAAAGLIIFGVVVWSHHVSQVTDFSTTIPLLQR